MPHKTPRGKAALERLKVFEGMPPPYDKKKRMVVPQALRVLRLQPGRKFCRVGRLSHEFGWKHADVVARWVYSTWFERRFTNETQPRGAEKGQGRRLLRAQEGAPATTERGRGEGKREAGDEEAAGGVRLLGVGLGWSIIEATDALKWAQRQGLVSSSECDRSRILHLLCTTILALCVQRR